MADVKIDIPIDDNSVQSFRTIEELESFLSKETEIWEQFRSTETKYPKLRNAVTSNQSNFLGQATNLSKTYKAKPSEASLNQLKEHLKRYSNTLSGARILCSLNAEDAAVLSMRMSDPDAATLGFATRQNHVDILEPSYVPANSRGDAILALTRFQKAGSKVEANQFSWTEYKGRIDEWAKNFEQHTIAEARKFQTLNKEFESFFEKAKLAHQRNEGSYEELIDLHSKKLQDIEEKFTVRMGLEKPVKYWKDRSFWAFVNAIVWLAIMSVFIAVIYYFGSKLLQILSDEFLPHTLAQDGRSVVYDLREIDLTKVLLPAAPVILLAAIPVIWVMRHISRMFVENINDHRDASLRATMTETYLALANMPVPQVSDTERAIILQALFRPSSAQTSDEGVPHPLVDLIANIKSKGIG